MGVRCRYAPNAVKFETRGSQDQEAKLNHHRTAVIAAVALMSVSPGAQSGLEYPMTRIVDHVDTYHGTTVHDPY